MTATAKENITPIGKVEEFINLVNEKVEKLYTEVQKLSGEATEDMVMKKFDLFREWINTETEEILKEGGIADTIRESLEELEEKESQIDEISSEVNDESVVVFKTETMAELMWVEEMRNQYNEKFCKKGDSDEFKSI